MVTIGFNETEYTVFEGDDVRVCVSLQSGMLATDRNVTVTLATNDVIGSGEMSRKCCKTELISPGAIDISRYTCNEFLHYAVNMDFTSLSVDLTFSNTAITQCQDVSTTFTADMPAMPFYVSLTTSEDPTAVSLNPAVHHGHHTRW